LEGVTGLKGDLSHGDANTEPLQGQRIANNWVSGDVMLDDSVGVMKGCSHTE